MIERETAARLHLVVGLPGAGKTTLARQLAERDAAVRLSPDEWMADFELSLYASSFRDLLERRLTQLAAELLRVGTNVVIEFGSWSRVEREHLLAVGRSAGASVELHVLDPGPEELWRRLSSRNAMAGETPIDRATLDGYRQWWEPPGQDERNAYDSVPRTVRPAEPDLDDSPETEH